MSVNVANILMGPATLYVAAYDSTGANKPADASVNTTPAASTWTDVGGTNGGVAFAVDPKLTALTVDQVVDNIGDRLTSRSIMVTTTLSETTLANLATVLNTTVGATGANFATVEPNFSSTASQIPYIALLLDGIAPTATNTTFRRRIYLPRVLQTGKTELMYSKDKQAGYSVTFTAYYVNSTLAPFHVCDQTS